MGSLATPTYFTTVDYPTLCLLTKNKKISTIDKLTQYVEYNQGIAGSGSTLTLLRGG
jgi:hypothetical protein